MKLFILFLFLLSFKVYSLPTRHERIDLMTVNQNLSQLLFRLDLEYSIHYTIEPKSSESDPRSNYDRLMMIPVNVKPTFPALQNELTDYKAELHVIEDARIVEVARVKDIRDRINALDHKDEAIQKYLTIPNSRFWYEKTIFTLSPVNAETILKAIESFHASAIKPTRDTQKIKEDNRKNARDFMKTANCNSLTNEIIRNMCLTY